MKHSIVFLFSLLLAAFTIACGGSDSNTKHPPGSLEALEDEQVEGREVVRQLETPEAAEPEQNTRPLDVLQWEQLNPARGDKSPEAANLWGNRNAEGACGFLVKFKDGFSSPAHIHNVSYRGLVISGNIHNDDPESAENWMPPGSYWTQPAGEAHITSAEGDHCMVYVEIEQGPYLVHPVEKAFDNGENAQNTLASELKWTEATAADHIESTVEDIELAELWNKNGSRGYLLKLPAGFSGLLRTDSGEFHAVMIRGKLQYGERTVLAYGAYFNAKNSNEHPLWVSEKAECEIYIRTNGNIRIDAAG